MAKEDLQSWIDQLHEQHGFRLDAIFPADAPRIAEMSADGVRLRLEVDAPAIEASHGDWVTGRAGMEYRDLIPSRLGGLVLGYLRIKSGSIWGSVVGHGAWNSCAVFLTI